MSAQSTDAANSAPLIGSKNAGNDLSTKSAGSAQKIAQDRSNQNTNSGSGDTPVTAPLSAGK